MVNEIVYMNERGVLVTSTRLVLGGRTYVLANVTSVAQTVANRAVWPLVIGVLLVLGGLYAATNGVTVNNLGSMVLGGCACAYFFWSKHTYFVVICTAGTELQAVSSEDGPWTSKVTAAINLAIMERG